MVQKGCRDGLHAMVDHIGFISHHLGSLLSAFICKVGYFDAQIRETLLHK